jgi:hypothetical protein
VREGCVYLIGGYGPDGVMSTVDRLNTQTGTWAPSGTVADIRCHENTSVRRWLLVFLTALRIRSQGLTGRGTDSHTDSSGYKQVYVIGGDNDGPPLNSVAVYDIGSATWGAGPALITARTSLGAAFAPASKLLFAVGGTDVHGTALSTVEYLDVASGGSVWRSAPIMLNARGQTAAVVVTSGTWIRNPGRS